MTKTTASVRGSKDVVQKVLLDKNEIFADVLNGFIFNGKQIIKPDMLADTNTTSYYKANGEVHGQDRDVAKLLTIGKKKIVISLVGIENQTRPDKHMPARVMNYDAAAYCYQLTKSKKLYPVLTLVVYYGKEAWNYSRNLLGNINLQKLPEEMRPLISDYKIKAFYRI
ncbi:Rpn family recombination-promoting nuclease/putative transposase, partial [Lactobacillus nasalidis]